MTKIKIHPLSINAAYRGGRRFLTNEAKQYINDILLQLPKPLKQAQKGEHYQIDIKIYVKELYRSDLSNFLKLIEDCLVKRGLIYDDRYVMEISLVKTKSNEEGFDFSVEILK